MEAIQMTDFFTMHPGETAAPVPPGPVLSTGSTGVRRVHRFLLWAYGEAPGLVRSVPAGDTARAAYVGEVLGNFDKVLLIHQEGQDLHMYAQLAERAPASTSHVGMMLDQHRQISERVQGIEPVRKRWMQTADADTQDEVAKGYEDVQAVLREHLRREVTEVMPVADRVITEQELMTMVQHGVRQHDKKFLVTYLGMILATNPPADRRAIFFDEIAAPVRLAYRLIGRRMYRKQYAKLFPGRPIPETL
ncbi:MAG TPA: hemerythrin domain-containing protein [Arthrobacter sp.]|nr:hemerythrin domain-containing protein [Arthrobacter sp.]